MLAALWFTVALLHFVHLFPFDEGFYLLALFAVLFVPDLLGGRPLGLRLQLRAHAAALRAQAARLLGLLYGLPAMARRLAARGPARLAQAVAPADRPVLVACLARLLHEGARLLVLQEGRGFLLDYADRFLLLHAQRFRAKLYSARAGLRKPLRPCPPRPASSSQAGHGALPARGARWS